MAERCEPPPIQRNWPESTSSTKTGSSVASPLPHTNRGRMTTVSRPLSLAARTASSALALVAGYSAGESGRRGVSSLTSTSACPAISAASVLTCTTRRAPASRAAASTFSVPWTLMRSNASGSPRSRTVADAPSDRASARTAQPSERSRSISRPPMKPEPPVTNALDMTGANLAQRDAHPRGVVGLVGLDQPIVRIGTHHEREAAVQAGHVDVLLVVGGGIAVDPTHRRAQRDAPESRILIAAGVDAARRRAARGVGLADEVAQAVVELGTAPHLPAERPGGRE